MSRGYGAPRNRREVIVTPSIGNREGCYDLSGSNRPQADDVTSAQVGRASARPH